MAKELEQARESGNFTLWENWVDEQLQFYNLHGETNQDENSISIKVFESEDNVLISPIVQGIVNTTTGEIEYEAPKEKPFALNHLIAFAFIHCQAKAIYQARNGYSPQSEFSHIVIKANEQFAGYN